MNAPIAPSPRHRLILTATLLAGIATGCGEDNPEPHRTLDDENLVLEYDPGAIEVAEIRATYVRIR